MEVISGDNSSVHVGSHILAILRSSPTLNINTMEMYI